MSEGTLQHAPEILRGEIRDIPIESVQPHPQNPNQGDVGAIFESIEENGFFGRILVQASTGYIIFGNHRWRAMHAAGATEIPAEIVDVDDERALKILLADNRTRDLASYDEGLLAEILQELAGSSERGLKGTGYDDDALADLLHDLEQENGRLIPENDPDLTLPEKPTSKRGQVYELGRHRLLCGDSTETEKIEAFLDGERIEVLWTDPPFGVEYVGKTKKALKIEGDDKAGLPALLEGIFRTADAIMRPGARFYIKAPAGPEGTAFRLAIAAVGWHYHQALVWCKDAMVLGHSDYHYQHEDVLYGWRADLEEVARQAAAADPEEIARLVAEWAEQAKARALEHLLQEHPDHRPMHDDILYGWKKGPGRIARGGSGSRWYGDHAQTTTFHVARPKRSAEHPTMTPPDLIRAQLANSTRRGDPIADLCGGSGSTLIVAEQLGLRAFIVEKDPRYCDVIRRRWAEYEKAIAIGAEAE